MTTADVTVVCATYNARDAVRLTFASYFRHNPGDARVFVADNGSTDGALEELSRWPRIEVVTLEQRLALLERERTRTAAALRRLAAAGTASDVPELDARAVGEHGATLDWLVERVTTPYVLVMDSDVEFLRSGCVEGLLAQARSRGLAALGLLEPGWPGYATRLAPYLLLLRTDVVRRLGVSFAGSVRFGSAEERARWEARHASYEATPEEIASYPSIRVYPTAARLFEALVDAEESWEDLPPPVRDSFRHFGHMSWGAPNGDAGASAATRTLTSRRSWVVKEALRAYD